MDKGRLCISRFAYQSILIGDDIEIYINRMEPDRVYLDIMAPKSVNIIRKELTTSPRKGKRHV